MAKKNGSGFTIDKLLDRGFVQGPDGTWSKGGDGSSPPAQGPPGPVSEPSSNKQRARKDHRKDVGKRAGPKSTERFQLVVVSYRSKLIDNSNAYIKHLEDAIVLAGLMPDDGPKYCPAPRFIQHEVSDPEEERTELYLFRLNEKATDKTLLPGVSA